MDSVSLISFLLLAAAAVFFLLAQKKILREKQKMRQLREKVEAALEDDAPTANPAAFASSLSDATMTTRLQRTRIQLQSGGGVRAPEKYQFFSNLVARGMNAEEIAEALNISSAEASQLVKLCGLSSCRN